MREGGTTIRVGSYEIPRQVNFLLQVSSQWSENLSLSPTGPILLSSFSVWERKQDTGVVHPCSQGSAVRKTPVTVGVSYGPTRDTDRLQT